MSVPPLGTRDSAHLPLLASGDTLTPCVGAVRKKTLPAAQRIKVLRTILGTGSLLYFAPTASLTICLMSARVSHNRFKSRQSYELKGAVLLSIGHDMEDVLLGGNHG